MVKTLEWFKKFCFGKNNVNKRRSQNNASLARRLRLESLESRELLAVTWTVNTNLDSGTVDTTNHTGYLRGVINEASAGDTINFNSSAFEGNGATISLGSQITINKNLTITVSDGYSVTLDGRHTTGFTNGNRIFNIGYAVVTLDGLTFQNGYAGANSYGGAILLTDGTRLTVKNSSFLNNEAYNGSSSGGAIGTASTSVALTVENSRFEGNSALNGGAIYFGPSVTLDGPKVIVANSAFYGNTAATSGGAIYATNAKLGILGTTMTNNTGVGGAGGVYYASGSESSWLHIVDSVAVGNKASGSTLSDVYLGQSVVTRATSSSFGVLGAYGVAGGAGQFTYESNIQRNNYAGQTFKVNSGVTGADKYEILETAPAATLEQNSKTFSTKKQKKIQERNGAGR